MNTRKHDNRNPSPFLRPDQIAPIRSLRLRARYIVEGMMAGLHKSPYHGFSTEFLEYRPYLPGESTRAIDWRKYAKTGRTMVRLFEDETNCRAHLLLDNSASMGFSSGGAMTKHEYARTLAASLAWIFIRQRDATACALFDEKLTTYIPPRSTNAQLNHVLGALDACAPSAGTRCATSFHEIAACIEKRGITIVISDFFDDTGEIINGIRHIRYKRQDVLLLWVLDREEQSFAPDAPLYLRDSETSETVSLEGETARRSYHTHFSAHRRSVIDACADMGIDCEVIGTDEPFAGALLRVVNKRKRFF